MEAGPGARLRLSRKETAVEVVICLLCVAYLLPFAVAARHEHERLGWIFAANVLLGWTVVGWLAVLYWARRPAGPPPEPAVRLRRGHLRLLEPPEGARDVPRLRARRARERTPLHRHSS
jgi:uncharacterized membrane protein YbhN (UPF0104 family)